MKIKLRKLTLTNFKGIRSKEINFDGEDTNIYGANGKGKSTVFDAFWWLLFGKNSFGKSDFEIKTLDESNNPIEKIEHAVGGILEVDGVEMEISRTLREKWVKPKGRPEAEFQGNETIYTWNDVPVSAKEFKDKIEASICSEEVFKMITSPSAFNDLHWKDQRKILFEMAGDMSDMDILDKLDTLGTKDQVSDLINILNQGKSFDEYKREVSGKKKRLNDELKAIPTRIDEINRNMPDAVNAQSINKMIEDLNAEIDQIDAEIADQSKANESVLKKKQEIQGQIHELRTKIQNLEHSDYQVYQQKVRGIEDEITTTNSEIARIEKEISTNKITHGRVCDEVITLIEVIKNLRAEWIKVNSSQLEFDDNEFSCPACKREFEASDIEAKKEELTRNFNNDKVQKINALDAKGKDRVQKKDALQKEADNIIQENKAYEGQLEMLRLKLDNLTKQKAEIKQEVSPQIEESKAEIITLQEKLTSENSDTPATSSELIEKKRGLNNRISDLRVELQANEQIEKANHRITELEAEAKTLGQEVANLERYEFLIDEFTKKKIESIEDNINSHFGLVKFKMYNHLINGGEEETCVAMVNGVPFGSLNTAMQINAGIDIINGLSRFYDVEAPIFIDRAESVNTLRHTNSQLVRLVVTLDQELVVETVNQFEEVTA